MKYIQFKGLFRDTPVVSQIIIITFLLLFSSLTLILIGEGILNLLSIENSITRIELTQLFSAVGMFIFAPISIAYLFSYHPKNFLSLRKAKVKPLLIAIATIFAAIPFINYISYLNEAMELPSILSGVEEWMREMEEKNSNLTYQMLSEHTFVAILIDILILALIPAIGEELLFRGVIQNGLEKHLKNPHIAIWISAIIFSAIHFQFYGFIPRTIMGALFGYMLYWSKSIWIPICCHFINNFIVIASSHLYPQKIGESFLDTIGDGDIAIGMISLLLSITLISIFYRATRKKNDY